MSRVAKTVLATIVMAGAVAIGFAARAGLPDQPAADPGDRRTPQSSPAANAGGDLLSLPGLPPEIGALVSADSKAVVRSVSDAGATLWRARLSDQSVIQLRRTDTGLHGFGYLADGRSFEVTTGADAKPAVRWRSPIDPSTTKDIAFTAGSEHTPGSWCHVGASPRTSADRRSVARAPMAFAADHGVATIDVVTLYTTDALQVHSAAILEVRARNSVAFANNVLACSQVRTQLRLVSVEPFAFAKTGTMKEFLRDKLSTQTTAEGKALWTVRQARAADVVMMIVGGNTHEALAHVAPPGGLATWWPKATALVTAVDGTPGVTLTHEIGHLMGAGHELLGPPDGSYAHAWKSAAHYTIMAATGNILVPLFSNPALTHHTSPIGINGQADNARALNDNRRVVEAWATPNPPRPVLPPAGCI